VDAAAGQDTMGGVGGVGGVAARDAHTPPPTHHHCHRRLLPGSPHTGIHAAAPPPGTAYPHQRQTPQKLSTTTHPFTTIAKSPNPRPIPGGSPPLPSSDFVRPSQPLANRPRTLRSPASSKPTEHQRTPKAFQQSLDTTSSKVWSTTTVAGIRGGLIEAWRPRIPPPSRSASHFAIAFPSAPLRNIKRCRNSWSILEQHERRSRPRRWLPQTTTPSMSGTPNPRAWAAADGDLDAAQ
jgi:hypothetical protein